MRTGSHARDDGSFGRSAGTQTLKGAALLVVALVIGVVLLRTAPRNATKVVTPGAPITLPAGGSGTASGASGASGSSGSGPTTTSPPHAASDVHVLVANATTTAGLAGRIRGQLSTAGYDTAKPAADASSNVSTSAIYFEPGFAADALAIAAILSLGQSVVAPMPAAPPVSASDLSAVDVLVVAGADIAATDTPPTTEAPPGSTIAPSGTVASSGTTTTMRATRSTTTTTPRSTTTRPLSTTTTTTL